MHGINTYQNYGLFNFVQQFSTSNSILKQFTAFCPDSPQALQNIMLNPNPSVPIFTQFWFKRLYNKYTIVNQWSTPVVMTVTRFRCRQNIAPEASLGTNMLNVLRTYMIDNSASGNVIDYPYFSNTTSQNLQKWYKILGRKRYLLRPFHPLFLTQRCSRRTTRKQVSLAVEADTTNWVNLKGNVIWYYEFMGLPWGYQTAGASTSTQDGFSPYFVKIQSVVYASYYRMDDAEPDNYVGAGLPPVTFNATLHTSSLPSHAFSTLVPGDAVNTDRRWLPQTVMLAAKNVTGTGLANDIDMNYSMGANSTNPVHTVTP